MPALGWILNLGFAGGEAEEVTVVPPTTIRRGPGQAHTQIRKGPSGPHTDIRRGPSGNDTPIRRGPS